MTPLQVGRRYRARGPAPEAKPKDAGKNTSGWWQPAEVVVTAVDEVAQLYRTEGGRQVAEVIRFGCEHHWQEVLA